VALVVAHSHRKLNKAVAQAKRSATLSSHHSTLSPRADEPYVPSSEPYVPSSEPYVPPDVVLLPPRPRGIHSPYDSPRVAVCSESPQSHCSHTQTQESGAGSHGKAPF
jgi:hypothetical protein